MKPYLIAPSILSADFARLGQECENVLASGADMIHFDVMDNHFVPNLTFGPMICRALRDYGIDAPIDVHLMVSPVESLIREFADAGADVITIHSEADVHVDRSLSLIRQSGCKAGLALNPATSLDACQFVMARLDLILLMAVNPGFGGQSFVPAVMDKIAQTRRLIDKSGLEIRLAVDGGVNTDNLRQIAQIGADTFIAGSAIFGAKDSTDPKVYSRILHRFRECLSQAGEGDRA